MSTARRVHALGALACAIALGHGGGLACAAGLAQHVGGIAIQLDNDEFATPNRYDRWYTSGARLDAHDHPDADSLRAGLLARWCGFVACAAQQTAVGFWSLGQNIYTQADRLRSIAHVDDRPVAGWLYLRGGALAESSSRLDSIAWMLGLTGPAALGKPVQDLVHRALGADAEKGWSQQLRPRLALGLRAGSSGVFAHGRSSDLLWSREIVLGNLRSELNAGLAVRFGPALRGSRFPGEAQEASVGRIAPGRWHLLGGLRVHAVAFDGLVEGPAFGYSPRVRARRLRAELFVGGGFALGAHWRFDWLLSRRQLDFVPDAGLPDNARYQRIGMLSLRWSPEPGRQE